MRFIAGTDRHQIALLPDCLNDYVAADNPVRAVDAFVDELDSPRSALPASCLPQQAGPATIPLPCSSFTPGAVRRRIEQVEAGIARYLAALDTADRQEDEVAQVRTTRIAERLDALRARMRELQAMEKAVEAAPDRQVSLTDPDARAMATSGKGTGLVGYNVQAAVDTQHHLVVAHEVTNVGHDRTQLAPMSRQAQAALGQDGLSVLADRGYFSGEEILACEQVGITVTLPRPLTSGAKADGRFGKQDFVYEAEADAYRCPAGERLPYRYTNVEGGLTLRRYWTTACQGCAIKGRCTPAKERRVTRWEHEAVLEAVQRRLDANPSAMRVRRRTVEHVFGTIKGWMGRRTSKCGGWVT
jgi:Transposase DDE domain